MENGEKESYNPAVELIKGLETEIKSKGKSGRREGEYYMDDKRPIPTLLGNSDVELLMSGLWIPRRVNLIEGDPFCFINIDEQTSNKRFIKYERGTRRIINMALGQMSPYQTVGIKNPLKSLVFLDENRDTLWEQLPDKLKEKFQAGQCNVISFKYNPNTEHPEIKLKFVYIFDFDSNKLTLFGYKIDGIEENPQYIPAFQTTTLTNTITLPQGFSLAVPHEKTVVQQVKDFIFPVYRERELPGGRVYELNYLGIKVLR